MRGGGASAALAILVRPELLYVIPVMLAFALSGSRRRGRRVAALLAGFLLAGGLATCAMAAVGWSGGYLFKGTVNVSLAARGAFEDPAEIERIVYALTADGERAIDEPARRLTLASLLAVVRRALRIWPDVAGNLLRALASPIPLFLAPLAFLVVRGSRDRTALVGIAFMAAAPLAMAACVAPHQRYLASAIPFWAILGAGGAIRLTNGSETAAEPTRSGLRIGRRNILVAVLLIAPPLPWAVHRPIRESREVPTVYRDAGRWMGEHLPRGRMLAGSGTYVSYYAGVPEYTFMPAATAEAIVFHARKKGIRYIVLDGRLRYSLRPGLEATFREDADALDRLGLRPVHSNRRNGGDRVVVLEVLSR